MDWFDKLFISEVKGALSGSVSSWDDLKDKPFGEYEEEYIQEVTEEMVVEWDGGCDGRVTVPAKYGSSSINYVLVSNLLIPDKASAVGSKATTCTADGSNSQESVMPDDQIYETSGCIAVGGGIVSISEENVTVVMPTDSSSTPVTFPHKGLYFVIGTGSNNAGTRICKYVGILTDSVIKTRPAIKPIDEKYLPVSERVEEHLRQITWDGVLVDDLSFEFDGRMMQRVDDAALSIDDLDGATLSFTKSDGSVMDVAIDESDIDAEWLPNAIYYFKQGYGGPLIVVTEDGNPPPVHGVVFSRKGVYFPKTDSYYVSKLEYTARKTIRSTAFDSIITDEMIIPSSTEGSTKKFKISIDDAGTITATEVV